MTYVLLTHMALALFLWLLYTCFGAQGTAGNHAKIGVDCIYEELKYTVYVCTAAGRHTSVSHLLEKLFYQGLHLLSL